MPITRTYASLTLHSSTLMAADVAPLAALDHAEFHEYGSPRGDRGAVWSLAYWGITSQNKIESTSLVDHVAWLLEQIAPYSSHVREVIERGLRGRVFCYLGLIKGSTIVMPPHLIQALAAANLHFEIDVYPEDDDEDEEGEED